MITITDVQRQSKENQIYLLRMFTLHTGYINIYVGPPIVASVVLLWLPLGPAMVVPHKIIFQMSKKQVQIGIC